MRLCGGYVCRERQRTTGLIESHRLLGWRLTREGTLILSEQTLGQDADIEGIDHMLEVIPARRATWRFLCKESVILRISSATDGCAQTRAGRTIDVAIAMRGIWIKK
jgi:hypothetical protein